MRRLFLLILFLWIYPTLFSFAQTENLDNPPIIEDINVTGLKILTKDEFLAYLPFKIGDVYKEKVMLDSLRQLFKNESLLDASVSFKETQNQNIIILYSVKERPWIDSIEYKGNDDLSNSTLKSKITTSEKSFLNDITLQKDVQTILMQYQGEGFIGTKVDVVKKTSKEGNTDIVFSIAEGNKLSVKDIHVYGTQTLSPLYLKSDFVTLKEPFFFNLVRYPFIPQAFEMEETKMVQLAYNQGFMDFKVIRTHVNANISYKPTLEHLTKKLREFDFSSSSIKKYKQIFTNAFNNKSKNEVDNLIQMIRLEGQDHLKNDPKAFNKEDLEIFLKALEIEGKALLNVKELLSKNIPPKISLDVLYTDQERSGYDVNFYISEGKPYIFTGLEIVGSSRVDGDSLKDKFLSLFPGSIYNFKLMQDFKSSVAQYFRDQGYFGVVIQDTPIIDKKRQTIKHRYIVQEGQKMHINRMYIEGNTKTKDFVIDRELRIKEGDVFSQSRIATSQRLLQRTGYFKNIEIIPSAGPEENLLDLAWKIEEQRTGNLQVGGGYGTETGISIFGSVSETNFLGYGINAAAKVSFGQYERGAQFSFSSNYINYLPVGWSISTGYDWIRQQASPRYDRNHDGIWDKVVQKEDGKYYFIQKGDQDFGYYFDENRSGTFNISQGSINPDGTVNFSPTPQDDIYSDDRYFDRQIFFLDLGAGYSFADFWSVNMVQSTLFSHYGNPHNIDMDNLLVDDYYSLKRDLSSNKWSYTSHVDFGISFNNTNSPLSPSEGIMARFGIALYGIEGGYDKFLRLDASLAGYLPLLDLKKSDFKIVWASGARISTINPFIGSVRLHYENQIGFNTMEEVRGWSNYVDDADLLGLGKISFGTEIRASIPYTNELLWLVGFFDGGNISDKISSLPYNFDKFLYSVGVGLRLDFPSFPVRFYLAQRLQWDGYFFKAIGGLNFEFSVTSAF